ncbi:VOC family protein [Rhodoblastus sp.]|uniref:VOC family protein n=1 Tax=Rhodoblastus sp. TaxID=1962975 RepID=UPI003F9B1DF5
MVGKFCWVELLTSDVEAAQAFYTDVLGWTVAASGLADRDYRIFSYGGHGAAGLMLLPEEAKAMGAPPHWMGYISSENVDADVEKVVAAGGKTYRPAETLPGIGRFAVLADPQGAAISLWQDLSGQDHPELPPMSLGRVGWHELYTGDVEQAFAFYSTMFGWTRGNAMDMGPMGVYQLFAIDGLDVGGIMRRPEQMPVPFWNYYFTVAALDEAVAKVEKGGGKVVNGPTEVPGGAWIVQAFDPQGVFFSLVAAKR